MRWPLWLKISILLPYQPNAVGMSGSVAAFLMRKIDIARCGINRQLTYCVSICGCCEMSYLQPP